jgi:hypothetical protein
MNGIMWCSQWELKSVAHQHEIVVLADLAEGAVEHLGRDFAIAAIEFLIGIHDPLGGLNQAFAVRMIAGKGDEGAHRSLRLIARGTGRRRRRRLAHMIEECSLGPRLDDSVHNGLSVRPAEIRRPGVSPGRPHQ